MLHRAYRIITGCSNFDSEKLSRSQILISLELAFSSRLSLEMVFFTNRILLFVIYGIIYLFWYIIFPKLLEIKLV